MVSTIYPHAMYSFDTSAFIESWRRYYPPDIFITLWEFISRNISNEIIIASVVVREELERQHDNLLEYVKSFSNLFKEPIAQEQRIITLIVNDRNYEHWGRGISHKADPFVIALASANHLCVVIYEDPLKNGKIPAACRDYNVDCCNFHDFLRRENVKI